MGFYLSEADTKSNPMKAVPTVQKMMYNWKSHDLWTQMSPNPFFSTVLLRSLHPSALLRHDDLLLQETQRFLRQQSLSPATSSSDKNPLFTFAATYLQTIQDSRKKFVSNSNLNKPRQIHRLRHLAPTLVAINLEVLSSQPPLVPLLLLHLPLQPLVLPALRARICTSMKASPFLSEPFVPHPALLFALPMSTFNIMPMVIPNVTSL